MKKSLSTILSLAVAFSMFSSMALAAAPKSTGDFTDLKDLDTATKAKFDTMISAGIFDGVKEGTFGLTDKMNRAQFAKVAALVFELPVDNTLKTSSFADVKATDPANGYALPYIEAIVKAGLTDGVAADKYDPAGEVTREQLATFLVRGLGQEEAAKKAEGVKDDTVSDWAKGYVTVALQDKLLENGKDGKFGGTTAATRDLLVLSSYEAKQQYVPHFNGQYAIASLKATDANQMTVKLNGAVEDTSLVHFDVQKNGAAVNGGYEVKWDDKKMTATLVFDSKFDDSNWTVTLSGLKNIDEANKTAKVATNKEKIEKIEFLTSSDTLPNNPGKKLRVDFKATNQYGVKTQMPASEFDVFTSNGTITPIGGEQAFYLTLPEGLDRNSVIALTIIHQDSNKQVNKSFTLGDKSIVSKVEVGDLLNSSGNKVESIDANGYAYLDTKVYDQYGLRIENKDELNQGVTVTIPDGDLAKGNEGDSGAYVDNAIGDDAADLKLRSVSDKAKEITISVYANGTGESVTKKIAIGATRVPNTLEFGAYNYNLAKGDVPTGDDEVDGKMYVPMVVKDQAGNVLTGQDIYDNKDKFTIFASGGIKLADQPISNSGAHKGMIAIQSADNKGAASITVQLKDNPSASTKLDMNVYDERKADGIKFSTTPKKYMIAGTDNEMKLKVYDQFGSEMKYDTNGQFLVRYSLTANSGDAASLGATSLASKQRVDQNDATSARKYVMQPNAIGTALTKDFTLAKNSSDSVDSIFDKSFKFYTTDLAKSASYTFKATLYKQDAAGTATIADKKYVEVNNLSTTMEVLDPNNVNNKISYEAYLDKSNNTLLATDDYFKAGDAAGGAAKNVYDNYKGFAKEVKVKAKNSSGEEVAVPSNIVSVSSSDTQAADVAGNWVVGVKDGTSKITTVFMDGKQNMISSSLDVTSKKEGPVVKSIALK
ncbi:S-layer homology domain-containing protein, partial [Paenibacillus thalictri]